MGRVIRIVPQISNFNGVTQNFEPGHRYGVIKMADHTEMEETIPICDSSSYILVLYHAVLFG